MQPIDFGQFYNPLYLSISMFGVLCIMGLIYLFGLNTVFAKKDKTRKSKRNAKLSSAPKLNGKASNKRK